MSRTAGGYLRIDPLIVEVSKDKEVNLVPVAKQESRPDEIRLLPLPRTRDLGQGVLPDSGFEAHLEAIHSKSLFFKDR